MRQAAISFKSGRLTLDGVLSVPQEVPAPFPALLVCHPHPRLGGTMDNSVVTAVCRAADVEGMASLRFNLRGVGASEGEFDDGAGEQKDIKAALDVLRRWPGVEQDRLALVGYSFGASVVLAGLRRYRAAKSLVLIAPPISSISSSRVVSDKRPKLFIGGLADAVVPPAELRKAVADVREPVRLSEIDADHSFRMHEGEVARRAVEFARASI